MIEIDHTIPPIFYECEKHFGVKWENIIITYYPKIHAAKNISDIKLAHELTHITQQKDLGAKEWWALYFQDKDFRFKQELEAYRQEVAYVIENVGDRNERYRIITRIAKDLSGSMYGNLVSFDEARKLLA